MSAFLARRWKRQPQGLLTVDRGHTLSTGLCAAWHPAARQYIGPGVATFPLDGTYAYQSDPSGGFGVKFNGAANSRIALPAGSAGGTSYSGTRLVLFRGFGNQWGLVSGSVASTLGMRLNAGAGQISLVAASAVVVGTGNVPASSLQTVALCTANQATTETRLHINGQLTFSGTSSYTASDAGIWVGAITNHNSDSNFFLALSWDRALSISEAAAIQENPWQIFRPKKTVVYSLPGNLFSALDEATSDRSDFIRSTVAGQVYETTLSPIQQTTGNINFVFDANSPLNTGGIKFDVLDGTNLVKSQTVTFPSSTSHFTITPTEYSSIGPSMFGRFMPQRWRQQPQGNVDIDWNNPLTKGLFLAMAPGISAKAFFRVPSNDPNFFSATIAPVVRYQSGTRASSTPFGRGVVGNVFFNNRNYGLGGYSLNTVENGGSPVYTYGAVYCQMATPDASGTSGFSYTNSHSTFSLQATDVSTFFLARNWTSQVDTTANDHNIVIPGGVPNQKQLTATVTWATGQPGRIYNGRQLLTSSNSTAWDGGYFAYNNLYLAGFVNGKTTALLGVTWLRALTDNDRAAFDEDPWQIFRPNTGRIYGMPPASVAFPWSPKLRVTSL